MSFKLEQGVYSTALGLAGGGAVILLPDQTWIGWSMVVLAVALLAWGVRVQGAPLWRHPVLTRHVWWRFAASPPSPIAQSALTAPLEEVRGKRFMNEIVDLDGKSFIKCEFVNVRLRYRGGHFRLTHNDFEGRPWIDIASPELMRYTQLLEAVGFLSAPFLDVEGGEITARTTFSGAENEPNGRPE